MRVVNRQCIVVLSILPVVLCLLMKKGVYSYTLIPRPQSARIGGVLFTIIVVVAILHFAQDVLMEFPPFRGRFTAWDSSRALRWLGVQCWTYPPLVVDG
jgi:hypothetical protein